jgi:GTP cyclohydrolase I
MNASLNPLLDNVSELNLSHEARIVRNALIAAGLETPMIEQKYSSEDQYEIIKRNFEEILMTLGLDLTDDSLTETPHRISKMFIKEIFSGLKYENFPKITAIENKINLEEAVCVKDISLISTCEHHFVTIDGSAKVSYVPNKKIIGLSKINRIIRFFAQRPQVQERLTQQILIALQSLLETENVAVKIDAVHYCVKSRGVMDSTSSTVTTAFGGCFKEDKDMRSKF